MMVELLLALALAAAMLPFLLRQESARVHRAENIKSARDIALVKTALEKYMEDHKRELMSTVTRNVVRVRISDLENYGLAPDRVASSEKFQLRIVKTADRGGRAFLQGIVVMDAEGMTPVRTREVANLVGETAGFADDNRGGAGGTTYGIFGTWTHSANIWNANFSDNSILDMTQTIRSSDEYLMRVASKESADAAMQSDLYLGGHNVDGARTIASESAQFAEFINGAGISAARLVVENRPSLDGNITISGESTVAGALSADSRWMETSTMTVSGLARFNSVTARELWAGDLSLSGISVASDQGVPAVLSVNRTIDMVGGRVSAMLIAVGFAGSVTPQLVVRERIEDASDSGYFWNVSSGDAVLGDLYIPDLNHMMQVAVKNEVGDGDTETARIMSSVAANANATVSDFIRALSDIESRVTAKYNQLNME